MRRPLQAPNLSTRCAQCDQDVVRARHGRGAARRGHLGSLPAPTGDHAPSPPPPPPLPPHIRTQPVPFQPAAIALLGRTGRHGEGPAPHDCDPPPRPWPAAQLLCPRARPARAARPQARGPYGCARGGPAQGRGRGDGCPAAGTRTWARTWRTRHLQALAWLPTHWRSPGSTPKRLQKVLHTCYITTGAHDTREHWLWPVPGELFLAIN
jgi:hypothetical protein